MVRPTDDPQNVRLQLRVSETFLKVVDDWRRKQPIIPTRSEAIKTLVKIGAESKAAE